MKVVWNETQGTSHVLTDADDVFDEEWIVVARTSSAHAFAVASVIDRIGPDERDVWRILSS